MAAKHTDALALVEDTDHLHDLMAEVVDTPAKARKRDRGLEQHGDAACVCCGRALAAEQAIAVVGEKIGPTCARKIARLLRGAA